MSNARSAEAPTNLTAIDVFQPIRALVIDGKPLSLAKEIRNAKNDAERIDLLTSAVHTCAIALGTRTITETKVNLRMRQIRALDDSEDNDSLLEALRRLENSDPAECKAVIRSLSVATILGLAQPNTNLAAFIVEEATPHQLASAANSISGTVFISEKHQREREQVFLLENPPVYGISDDPELSHSRKKAIRRRLGQFLDLVAETGDEPLENFALEIAKYQPKPDGPSSPLFDTICTLAEEDGRESAIELILLLPETPRITRIKLKLGLDE